VIGAQAFQATPREHAPAVVRALVPNLACWARTQVDGALKAGTSAAKVGMAALGGAGIVYHGMELLGGGAILARMILGAVAALIIDREFSRAATYWLAGAKLGIRESWEVALGYLLAAIRWDFARRKPSRVRPCWPPRPRVAADRLAGRGLAALRQRHPARARLPRQAEGAEFLGKMGTVPVYRLYSIDDRHPGMFEVASGGVSVAGELRLPDGCVAPGSRRASRRGSTGGRSASSRAGRARAPLSPRPRAGTGTSPPRAADAPITRRPARGPPGLNKDGPAR
jgi:hypothetical protein